MLKGFREFITKGNAVDLAVGVVIGAAFTAVVTSLVNGLINPLIAAVAGKPDFDNVLVIPIGHSSLHLGLILTAIINFLLVAAAVYFVIVLPINKLRAYQEARKNAGVADEEELTELDVLKSIDERLRSLDDSTLDGGKHAE